MSTQNPFEKTRDAVAEKVRKLLTQAEDPAATPDEARAFTAKAQQLITKYSIELAMIADAAKAHQLVEKGWRIDGPYAGHKVDLVNAVARANDCRTIYADLSRGRKHIGVVGYATDVDWVETLTRSLEIQLTAALAGAVRGKPPHVHGRTFAVAFMMGFTAEVSSRLYDARHSAVATAESARARDTARASEHDDRSPPEQDPPPPSVALVLVAKGERVDEEFKVRHPTSRTVWSHVRLLSWSGYRPGRDAGRRARLARGSLPATRRSLSA